LRETAPFLLPLILIVGVGVAGLSIVSGLRQLAGARIGPYLIIPGLVGLLIIAAELILYPAETLELFPRAIRGGLVAGSWLGIDAVWSIPIGLLALVAGILAGELAIAVLPAYAADLRQRLARREGGRARSITVDVTRVVLGAVLGGALLAAAGVTSSLLAAEESGDLVLAASLPVASTPTSLVATGSTTGYVAFGEGTIARFTLPETGTDIALTTVAEGLSFPRGLAVVDDDLFVVDLGPLPCDPSFPICAGSTDFELGMLRDSDARVLRYPINPDGSLGEATPIVTGLPVASSVNAPGGIEVGADGYLYLTIANIDDTVAATPDRLDAIDPRLTDQLGTIIRFRPDGTDRSEVASGLRNIYELTQDPDGHLFGVNNGGITAREALGEEVLWIQGGVDYGFPQNGTFSAGRDPESRPLTVLPVGGSGGLLWMDDLGGDQGLLIGTSREIEFIPIATDDAGPYVHLEHPLRTPLEGVAGFVASFERLPDGRILAAVFGGLSGLRSELMLFDVP
jgi:hypothetical protein